MRVHEQCGMANDDLGDRLTRALAALNVSRARLAAVVGVDKSVVGRWTRGLMRPSEHNLSLITAWIAHQRPGFDMTAWAASATRFAALLVPPAIEPAELAEWLPVSAFHSAIEVKREGDGYCGIHLLIRQRFMTPALIAELFIIWRDGDTLRMHNPGAFWNFRGRGFILHHQLYFIAEDADVHDGLVFWMLNGVAGGAMLATDGLFFGAQGYRERPPSVAPAVMLRLAALCDRNAEPEAATISALQARLDTVIETARVDDLAGSEIVHHLAGGGSESDRLLRMPASRGFCCTANDAPPSVINAVERWRQALFEDAGINPSC